MSDSTERWLCPTCLAFNLWQDTKCFHCAGGLAYGKQFASVRESLLWSSQRRESAGLSWQIRLRWHGRELNVDEQDELQLTDLLPGASPLNLERNRDGSLLHVAWDGRKWTEPLPCLLMLGSIELEAWCVPRSNERSPTAPSIGSELKCWPVGRNVLTVGKASDADVRVLDATCAAIQAVLFFDEAQQRAWIADTGDGCGTFVNGRMIHARLLEDGDFIQVASMAFAYSAENQQLHLVHPIPGVALSVEKISLRWGDGIYGRPSTVEFRPGQFTMVRGISGAGKSTLIKAILGVSGTRKSGTIRMETCAGRIDLDQQRDQGRRHLGYVSQDSLVHPDLTPSQTWQLASALRCDSSEPHVGEQHANGEFERLGLPVDVLTRPISKLSGGQNKRVRLALELIHRPGLLLADEPDSGLDEESQKNLMRLFRSLAFQGCTVVVVTHGPQSLNHFADRVLEIDEGTVVSQSAQESPAEKGIKLSADWRNAPAEMHHQEAPTEIPGNAIPDYVRRHEWDFSRFGRQFRTILRREYALSRKRWKSHWLLPLLVVAPLFAVSLGLAVPASQSALLGFLAIISLIWMSSSLTVNSISAERVMIDHERRLFLDMMPYGLAKIVAGSLIALVQTAVFILALYFVRRTIGATFLMELPRVAVVLGLTSLAASGLGLLLSAVSGNRREIGLFLLPLVLLMQLVCSAPIANTGVSDSFERAYGNFKWNSDKAEDASPNPQIVVASYFTISRYADMALRTFAYAEHDAKDFRKSSPRGTNLRAGYWRAASSLVLSVFIFTGLALAVLEFQTRPRRLS